MNTYLSLLQLRPKFRSLWLAQVISLTGDWFNTIASVIIVNRYAASGLAVGGLFIARALQANRREICRYLWQVWSPIALTVERSSL